MSHVDLQYNNTLPTLLHRYGNDICHSIHSRSADAMDLSLMLVLHLCIVHDLELKGRDCDVLRQLMTRGGPVFLQRPHKNLFFDRTRLMARFNWTKKQYSLVE
ncbi:uncharacterized protein LOC124359834 [Homalodisca vitripennis]|uniref:uncharacterized protein LOC124359834 n=1 Tax=Homalodisca vitripennis TaxID=197043 RepID=UPI001EEA43F2|nr:uncharacterized protein LOC124359834 [Homalodisca vitripennis]